MTDWDVIKLGMLGGGIVVAIMFAISAVATLIFLRLLKNAPYEDEIELLWPNGHHQTPKEEQTQ